MKVVKDYTCPICEFEGNGYRPILFKSYIILKCSQCEHRWLKINKPDYEKIIESYSTNYTGFREDVFFRQRLEYELDNSLKSYIPNNASILDYGCGNGTFLSVAAARGYKVTGYDISASAQKLCNERGLDNVYTNLASIKDQKFDLITMWDVVEHLDNPVKIIQHLVPLLKINGRILTKIPAPSPKGFSLTKLLPRLSLSLLSIPAHIQFFNDKSLQIMFDKCQLSTIENLKQNGSFRKPKPKRSLLGKFKKLLLKSIKMYTGDKNYYVIVAK